MRTAATIGLLAGLLGTAGQVEAQSGPVGAPGRYVIVHSPHIQSDTVLLDTATGRTWQLVTDTSRGADFWTPLAREDNPAEIDEWAKAHPKATARVPAP